MHLKKLRDTLSWKISEIELFIIVLPFETNHFYLRLRLEKKNVRTNKLHFTSVKNLTVTGSELASS